MALIGSFRADVGSTRITVGDLGPEPPMSNQTRNAPAEEASSDAVLPPEDENPLDDFKRGRDSRRNRQSPSRRVLPYKTPKRYRDPHLSAKQLMFSGR